MSARTHVVLVPGFAGFDALGQIHYYAGTSGVFRRWLADQAASSPSRRSVLHYFDNLPSGSVASRAARLRAYLSKRIARNEFQPQDCIALVGHSTGGLDIRHLLMELVRGDQQTSVDGPAGDLVQVGSRELLGMIRRVVFLSTPHFGSSLVDGWLGREGALRSLFSLTLLGVYVSRVIPSQTLCRARAFHGIDAVYAVQDALLDMRSSGADDMLASAAAHETFAQVRLWLRQMASDVSVLTDLRTDKNSQRAEHAWPANVVCRSYATVSPPAQPGPSGLRSLLRALWPNAPQPAQDGLYRRLYHATASGRIRPESEIDGAWFAEPAAAQIPLPLDATANDGVVNTASMFWRHGGPTLLVCADHGDIIGHYRRTARAPGAQGEQSRRFESYDFFKSGAKFDRSTFEAIWRDIFGFCSAGLTDPAPQRGRAARAPC